MPTVNLSRRSGEAIIIDEKTTIRVLGVSHGGIALGIDAPDDVLILREELLEDRWPSGGLEPINR